MSYYTPLLFQPCELVPQQVPIMTIINKYDEDTSGYIEADCKREYEGAGTCRFGPGDRIGLSLFKWAEI